MRGKIVVVAVMATLALALGVPAASAHRPRRPHCHAGRVAHWQRVRVRRHHHRVWVHQWRCVRPRRRLVYRTEVDPTFTQSPTNPLAVTYAYDASAFAGATSLGAVGQLPDGVLNFYSQTVPGAGPMSLFCSMNVGGSVTGGSCPITYSQTGSFLVTTEYIPNAASAVTQTESETIAPYTTAAAVAVSANGCPSSNECDYTLTPSVTDQNGNRVPGMVAVTFLASDGTSYGTQLQAGQPCAIQVFDQEPQTSRSAVLSSGCNFSALAKGPGVASWSVSGSYAGAPGWTGSTATSVSVAP